MAYVSQEYKNKVAPVIKALCKEYGIKATLAVHNHSTLVLNIKSGPIDFIGVGNRIAKQTALSRGQQYYPADTYSSVNVYWIEDHYDGAAREFLTKAYAALKGPDFFDHSDAMTDYFHRSHYQDINIGRWNRPYVYTPETKPVKKSTKKAAKKTAKVRSPRTERTVKGSGKTSFYAYTEVQGYDPRSNTEPDPHFTYVATLEQLRAQ